MNVRTCTEFFGTDYAAAEYDIGALHQDVT